MNTLRAYMARNRVTQKQLAERLDVTQGLIYQWVSDIRKVSAERVLSVCKASNWQITPHELRPDIYPNPSDGVPPAQVVDPSPVPSVVIKPFPPGPFTPFTGGGYLYSTKELTRRQHERRHSERRREAERRCRERREQDRRMAG